VNLKAQRSRLPFVALTVMLSVGVFSCMWVFLRTEDFSVHGFVQLFGILATLFMVICFLVFDFKKGQSVELTNDGVWSLVWIKPTKARLWPRLERVFLKWENMEKWKMRANAIYLYWPRNRVVVNILLFEDGDEIVKFINKATKSER
jgi:hypothetical protein